jgi:hypothetical protein
MAEPQRATPPHRVTSGQVREALDRLEDLFIDGVKHGFFRCSITCETLNGKRHVVIEAGKSHKFTIPEHEVSR